MEGWHLLMAVFGAPFLLWLYAMWRWGGFDIRGDLETARRKNRMRREERERGARPVHPEGVPPIERLRGE